MIYTHVLNRGGRGVRSPLIRHPYRPISEAARMGQSGLSGGVMGVMGGPLRTGFGTNSPPAAYRGDAGRLVISRERPTSHLDVEFRPLIVRQTEKEPELS